MITVKVKREYKYTNNNITTQQNTLDAHGFNYNIIIKEKDNRETKKYDDRSYLPPIFSIETNTNWDK